MLLSSSFYVSALRDFQCVERVVGVLLAQLRCELIQVFLRFLLTVEECFGEICPWWPRIRPRMVTVFTCFLERFGLLESALGGVVKKPSRLLRLPGNFDRRQASPLLEYPASMASNAAFPFILDAACSVSVFL